jgi:hypothetical protein
MPGIRRVSDKERINQIYPVALKKANGRLFSRANGVRKGWNDAQRKTQAAPRRLNAILRWKRVLERGAAVADVRMARPKGLVMLTLKLQ